MIEAKIPERLSISASSWTHATGLENLLATIGYKRESKGRLAPDSGRTDTWVFVGHEESSSEFSGGMIRKLAKRAASVISRGGRPKTTEA